MAKLNDGIWAWIVVLAERLSGTRFCRLGIYTARYRDHHDPSRASRRPWPAVDADLRLLERRSAARSARWRVVRLLSCAEARRST
jgi:hypothetical protein